jgi:hypothetical protein
VLATRQLSHGFLSTLQVFAPIVAQIVAPIVDPIVAQILAPIVT